MGLKNCAVASTICIIVTVCSYSDNICASKKYALITSPVADLYHSPDIPSTLPIPAMTNTPCARINQALFNEVFEITKTNGNMIALSIPWAIYGYDKDNKPLNTYWIRSENFVTLDAIPSKHRYALPFFDRKHDVITLIRPFTTPRGVTYSVGTEFVCSAKQDSPHTYQVYYLDIPAGIIRTLSIPRTKAIAHKKRSQAQARKVCVKLLREFVADIAQQKSYNTIPYVWGGNSFVKAYTTHFTQNVGGFSRTEHETVPLSGYDCSSLILRFSRIAGVPYYFKTTALLEKHGSALSSTDTLQEGDIIWMPGHVVIITDLARHEITEADGYESSFGKVQTIKLSTFFRNMSSWQDLLNAYHEQKIVTRLDAAGHDFKKSTIKIFKLTQDQA